MASASFNTLDAAGQPTTINLPNKNQVELPIDDWREIFAIVDSDEELLASRIRLWFLAGPRTVEVWTSLLSHPPLSLSEEQKRAIAERLVSIRVTDRWGIWTAQPQSSPKPTTWLFAIDEKRRRQCPLGAVNAPSIVVSESPERGQDQQQQHSSQEMVDD
jgi:hypothetical protein